MITLSHISHIDDTVIVIVTSHKVIEKDIEGSRKIILYNIYNIY